MKRLRAVHIQRQAATGPDGDHEVRPNARQTDVIAAVIVAPGAIEHGDVKQRRAASVEAAIRRREEVVKRVAGAKVEVALPRVPHRV